MNAPTPAPPVPLENTPPPRVSSLALIVPSAPTPKVTPPSPVLRALEERAATLTARAAIYALVGNILTLPVIPVPTVILPVAG